MSSQDSYGSNMLFQAINDDLNASLATADELSKEFFSLMQEASSSNDNKPSGSQTSSNTFRNQSQSIGSPSLSRSTLSSGTSSSSKPLSSNQTYYSPIDSGISSSSSRNVPSPPVASFGSSGLSSSTLPSGRSSNGSPSFKPFSPSQTYFNPIDSGLSSGRNAPSPPVISNSPHSSPKMQRSSHPQRRSEDNFSFKQAPISPRPDSPSYYERSPQGLIGYKDRTSSPSRKSGTLDQSPRSASPHALLSSNDSSMMGIRSPRHDKGRSPLTFNQPHSSTLPRNLYSSGQTDEGMKLQKSPNKWNETDLDATYERKPHHTYDKTEWLRSPVPSSNWRESNLDGPPLASNPKKDHRLLPQQGSYGSLPRNTRMLIPLDISSQVQFQREIENTPYYSQPLSRISVPPNSSPFHRRKALPLSVILRLQNPLFGARTTQPSKMLEEERDFPPYQPPVPILQEFFHQPAFQPQQQPPVPSDVLLSGDVDAEIERLDSGYNVPVTSENPASPGGGGGEVEQAVPPAPRPLSPTRLQPVVAPEARSQELPDPEELLRLRAEIPRPLKRRGSVDPTNPQTKASHYQRNQYKYAISNFFRRDRNKGEQRSESGSSSDGEDSVPLPPPPPPQTPRVALPEVKNYPTILRKSSRDRKNSGKRARLNPLVLLLDGALVGELDTVKKAVQEMTDPSQPNDEGITGLHNAVCGGHRDVVDFLVRIGVNVSAPDSHGWTPLHCAASCNDRGLCEFLVRNGAAVMAMTHSDGATAVQKCDPYLPGFEDCEGYLRGVEEAMGVENSGVLYALWGHQAQAPDELSFKDGDMVTILQKQEGSDWWWASLYGREGFVPNNYFGLFPKVRPKSLC